MLTPAQRAAVLAVLDLELAGLHTNVVDADELPALAALKEARDVLAVAPLDRPRWLCVDGADDPDPVAAVWHGAGQHAPFYVFDADGQANVAGPLPTRNAAERVMSVLLCSGACDALPIL